LTTFWIVVNECENPTCDADMTKVIAIKSLIRLILVLAGITIISGEQKGLVMA